MKTISLACFVVYLLAVCNAAPLPRAKRQIVISPFSPNLLKPYEFGYQSVDEVGTNQHRQETSDGNSVKGSYGYLDPLGVYRTVRYTADADGYRAVINTNEPGMGAGNSANAVYIVQPPPPAALLWQDSRNTPAKK
ncbi:cuticle protein 16.8-like [Stegodyphus dumicola]|uniref:cuticle protein 16.8-like n=1 Tax=Stegodyphus dumicola TaxID=202533 RepID=UPI0015AAEC57|nr:cuticle protein 16.8-like [Stegodyphus dumicola]